MRKSRLYRLFVMLEQMSKRLDCIASKVRNGRGVVDVGTDHAYLPLLLLKRGYKGNIIATDINDGPLQKAHQNIAEYGAEGAIELFLCNGLDSCRPELVDDIVIAGMGGDIICGILDRAPWCERADMQLILQPVTKPEILRYWLINNGFRITGEELVFENGTIYQIITAVPGKAEKYTDAELFTGSFDVIKGSPLLQKHIETHIVRFEKASAGLSGASRSGLSAWRQMLLDILSELYDIRRACQ